SEPLRIGDEVVSVNGIPVTELMRRNLLYETGGTYESRQIAALESILVRDYSLYPAEKEGASVKIVFRRGEHEFEGHLNWVETKEFQTLNSFLSNSLANLSEPYKRDSDNFRYGMSGTVRS